MPNELVRFSIQLPAHYDRWIRLWSFVKGTTRAALAANVIQARIEANKKEISEALQEIASLEKITLEQLMLDILDKKE